MCLIRMWSIIDDHSDDKHGDSPIIDDFCTEHFWSIETGGARGGACMLVLKGHQKGFPIIIYWRGMYVNG